MKDASLMLGEECLKGDKLTDTEKYKIAKQISVSILLQINCIFINGFRLILILIKCAEKAHGKREQNRNTCLSY